MTEIGLDNKQIYLFVGHPLSKILVFELPLLWLDIARKKKQVDFRQSHQIFVREISKIGLLKSSMFNSWNRTI